MQTALLKDSLWVLGTRLVMRGANFVVFILLAGCSRPASSASTAT